MLNKWQLPWPKWLTRDWKELEKRKRAGKGNYVCRYNREKTKKNTRNTKNWEKATKSRKSTRWRMCEGCYSTVCCRLAHMEKIWFCMQLWCERKQLSKLFNDLLIGRLTGLSRSSLEDGQHLSACPQPQQFRYSPTQRRGKSLCPSKALVRELSCF